MNASEGKVALVTGSAAGIGEAAAQALLGAGFTVYGTSRKAEAGEVRKGVTFLPLDVTDGESIDGVVKEVLDRSGRIDVLVNNAGIGIAGAAEESSVEQVRWFFESNLFGAMSLSRAVMPHMRERGSGRIINVSSVLGLVPAPFSSLYAASKHALEGYSESMDHEVREQGIRVLLVEPAYTKTSFDTNAVDVDQPLSLYANHRDELKRLTAAAIASGDDPKVVGETVVSAATDARPKVRYAAGKIAGRISLLRRFAPARLFDGEIRKRNHLDG